MSWKLQSEKLYEHIEELKTKVKEIDRTEKSNLPPIVIEALLKYRSKINRDITSCLEYKQRITKKGR